MRFRDSGVELEVALGGSKTLPLHLVGEVAELHQTCLNSYLARWEEGEAEGHREGLTWRLMSP